MGGQGVGFVGELGATELCQFLVAVHPEGGVWVVGWSGGGTEASDGHIYGQGVNGVGRVTMDGGGGEGQSHVCRTCGGSNGDQVGRFSGDLVAVVCPTSWGGQAVADEEDRVPDSIVQSSFADVLALEEVVSMQVQWGVSWAFGAGQVLHVRREHWEAQLALQHDCGQVIGEPVGWCAAIVVAQRQGCVWSQDGWQHLLDVRGCRCCVGCQGFCCVGFIPVRGHVGHVASCDHFFGILGRARGMGGVVGLQELR